MTGLRCIELAGPQRARRVLGAFNARGVRRRRDRKVVEIQLANHGDDTREPARLGNPQRYSHDSETDTNPANVWTLKRIALRDRAAFQRVVEECIAA
jgi:hypothetical protein